MHRAVEKDTEYSAPGKFFGPSYFVTTLGGTRIGNFTLNQTDGANYVHIWGKLGNFE